MSVLRKSGSIFVLKVFSSISALALNFLIANIYSPSTAGSFYLCITIVLIFSQLARIGTDTHIVRKVSTGLAQNEYNIIFTAVLLTSLFISLIVFASRFLFESYLDIPDLSAMLFWISPSITFYAVCNHLAFYGQGIRKPYIFVLGSNFLQVLCTVFFLILFYLFDEGESNYLSLSYLLGCITAFIILMKLLKYESDFSIKLSLKGITSEYKKLISETLPLLISTTLQLCTVWFSQFLIAYFLDSEDVATFTISQRVAMLTSFILVAINSVVSPKFAKLYSQNKITELKLLAKGSSLLGFICVIPFIMVIIAVPDVILSLFGEHYLEGTTILIVLSFAQVINVATGGVGYLLQMSGHYKHLTISNVLGFVSVSIFGILLVENYGLMGGAFTSLLGVLVSNLYLFWKVRKVLGFYNFTLDVKVLKSIL